MTLLINLYWHPHTVWKRGLKSVWRKFTSLPHQNMNLFPGDKLHCCHKTQSSTSSCSFPYSFLHPCPVSGGDGGPCRAPDKPEPVKQEPVRAIFTAGAPGASLSFSALPVSHLSLSPCLLISETSMTSILMHLRKLFIASAWHYCTFMKVCMYMLQ